MLQTLKDNWEIIGILLTSSFLGAIIASIITGAVNWYISSKNYKLKTYEEIAKKRINAYEKMVGISYQFKLYISDNQKIIPYVFANGIEYLNEFQMVLMQIFVESFWLDQSIGGLFTELNTYIHNVDSEAKSHKNPSEFLKEIAVRDKDKIKDLNKRLSNQIRIDLLNIHQVERFIRKTSPKTPKYKVMSWTPHSSQQQS
jgi:hypothetical protein